MVGSQEFKSLVGEVGSREVVSRDITDYEDLVVGSVGEDGDWVPRTLL